ncbi:porin [Mesorhizobium sp. L-8-3]|uniref:porin n=1 Tax=Mesorhizobium sp. L-8-3 TaxID=2744522 RepID=UPI00192774C8|nr:porin [Mesorhizobium sp. L-8-3]BCH22114.1 porin [Mesorhizobium sp. L-8-3]
MKYAAILLGSAAGLIGVPLAQAADAVVVAEPEPVEYVRVCETYGAGFFYIPGTETCLSVNGWMWYQIGAEGYKNSSDTPAFIGGAADADGWIKSSRARLNFDARSETDWGTLRSFIRLEAEGVSTGGVDFPVGVDQAFVQLGGFYAGYTESAWSATRNGGASNWGAHSYYGMYYGYSQAQQIGYDFTGAYGLFGTVSLEDDALAGDGYMPDIVAKVGVNQGWGSVWAKFGYDESRPGAFADEAGWGAGLGLQLNVPNSPGSSLRMLAFYSDSDNTYGSSSALGVNSEWSVLGSYFHQFTPEFAASAAFQYFGDLYSDVGSDVSSGLNAYGAELNLVWSPVLNFEISSEIHFDKVDGLDGTPSGFLRFKRYF